MKKKVVFFIFLFVLFISDFVSASYFIDVNIPSEYVSIHPGDSFQANIKIIRIPQGEIIEDINLEIKVRDKDGNILVEKSKIIAIGNEIVTTGDIHVPINLDFGVYNLEVEIEENKSGTFFIVENPKSKFDLFVIYTLILILLLSVIGFYFYNRKLNKLLKQIHKKVTIRDLVKRGRK